MIEQHEMARVLPVIGNVGLDVLLERDGIGPAAQGATGPETERALVAVAQILEQLERRPAPRWRAFGAWEGAEVIVKGVVLLDNDDHVIDGNGAFSGVAWGGVDERGVGRAGVDAAHSARAAGARATRRAPAAPRPTGATRASGAAGIHERRIVAAGCDKQKRQAKFWQAHTSRSGASLGGIGRTSQAPTILAVFLMACSTPPERRALPDASAALTLRVDNTSRPLQAWYSIFLHPPEGTDAGGVTADLVVTLVEPAFRCAGAAPSGL